MTRRGAVRHCLTLLMALLTVTPQVILRPCCCAGSTFSASKIGVNAEATPAKLSPCCLKRLQAAQKAKTDKSPQDRLDSHLPGVHDSSKCGCGTRTQVARISRAVFKALDQRHTGNWITVPVGDHESYFVSHSELLITAQTAPPDWGAESSIRLCRWLV